MLLASEQWAPLVLGAEGAVGVGAEGAVHAVSVRAVSDGAVRDGAVAVGAVFWCQTINQLCVGVGAVALELSE